MSSLIGSLREGHLNPVLAPEGEILSATKTFHGFRPTGQPAAVQIRSKRQVRGQKTNPSGTDLVARRTPAGFAAGKPQNSVSKEKATRQLRLALLRSPAALAIPGQTFGGLPVRLSAHPLRFSLAGRGRQKGSPLPFAAALRP